jgi:O-antigen/teichoic acid export membrane protein
MGGTDVSTKEIAKGSFWLSLGTGLGLFLSMLSTIVLARLLDIENWGIFSVTIAVSSFISTFYDFGIGYTVTHKISELGARGKTQKLKDMIGILFKTKLAITLIFAILLFLFSDILAELFHVSGAGIYFKASISFFILFNIFSFFDSIFIGFKRFRDSALFNSTHFFMRMLFSAGFVMVGFGINGAMIGYATALALTCCAQYYLLRNYMPFNAPGRPTNLTPLLSYGFFLGVSSMASAITGWTDSIILGIFMGAVPVGMYRIAFSISNAIATLVGSIGRVTFPIFSAAEAKKEQTTINFNLVIKYSSYFAIPTVIGLSILANPIVTILFGAQYSESASALWILSYLVFDAVIVGSLVMLYAAKKETKLIGMTTLIAAFANILLNIMLIPILGMTGSATASVITRFGCFIYLAAESKKRGVSFNFNLFTKPVIGSMVMALILICLTTPVLYTTPIIPVHDLFSLLLIITIGIITYCLFERLIGFDITPFLFKLLKLLKT